MKGIKGYRPLFQILDEINDVWSAAVERSKAKYAAQEVVKKALQTNTVTVGGTTLYNVHDGKSCLGPTCWIHRPSQHHMLEWPKHWRSDRYILERICDHGVGHPDPDQPFINKTHGCCGCCHSLTELG